MAIPKTYEKRLDALAKRARGRGQEIRLAFREEDADRIDSEGGTVILVQFVGQGGTVGEPTDEEARQMAAYLRGEVLQ